MIVEGIGSVVERAVKFGAGKSKCPCAKVKAEAEVVFLRSATNEPDRDCVVPNQSQTPTKQKLATITHCT